MPANATTLYLSISADVEISITLQARRFNGIDTDPKVILSEPTIPQIHAALSMIRQAGLSPSLDFPTQP